MNQKKRIERFNRELDAMIEGENAAGDREDTDRLAVSRRFAAADFSGRSRLRETTRARLLDGPGRSWRPVRSLAVAAVLILAVAGVGWLVSNLPVQPALLVSGPVPTLSVVPTFTPKSPQVAEAPSPYPASATIFIPGIDQGETNVRTGPGANYSSAGTIAVGMTVTVMDVSVDGEWYRIEYAGMPEGETWIYRDFLDFNAVPLTAASTNAEIRERLRESITLLDTLWADVLVLTESKGETHTDRQQVWIKLPTQSRWVSGIDESPPHQSLVTSFGQTALLSADCERFKSNATTLQIGELDSILFPAHFAARPGIFEAVREEVVAGRLALVVEWRTSENRVEDRLWIDVETGVVLRWENLFPEGPDGAGRVEPSEIRIEEILYGVDIPEGRFGLGATCGPDQEPPVPPDTEPVPAVVAPGTGEVVVRSGPGTDFEVVGQVLEGETVYVVGVSESGDWYRILYLNAPDGAGWVYGELLEFEDGLP